MQIVEKTEERQEERSDAAAVRTRAVSGAKALAMRTAVSVILRIVSSLVLARLLFPADYGLFAVASYITGLGMFLSDVGLGGALVRQAQAPTKDESFTVFISQQALTAVVALTVIVSAPWIIHSYHLTPNAAILLIVMTATLFLSSLRVVPVMALERALRFPAIARCEMMENVVQTVTTILLAYLHFGAWALAGGTILRGFLGLIYIWSMSPWRPNGKFRPEIVKRLARFGVAMQLNAIVPSLVNGWLPIMVGRMLGIASVGLVGWATNIASVPLMLSAVLNRVAFPAYSRLQSDPEALGNYLTSSVRRIGSVFCILLPLVVIAAPALIPEIFHKRWTAAVPLVQWFCLECGVLTITGLLASAQNALGRAEERLAVTIAVGVVRWGAGFLAIKAFGIAGIGPTMFAITTLELALTTWLVWRRTAGSATLPLDIFRPLLAIGMILKVSLIAGAALAHDHIFMSSLVSLVTFAALLGIFEFVTRGRLVARDAVSMVSMLRSSER